MTFAQDGSLKCRSHFVCTKFLPKVVFQQLNHYHMFCHQMSWKLIVLLLLLQYGQWMGQPFPARRWPVQRGRWDRRVDQGRQADHADTRWSQSQWRCCSARELCGDRRHRHDHSHCCEPRQRQRSKACGPRSRGAAACHRGTRRRQPSRARCLEEET